MSLLTIVEIFILGYTYETEGAYEGNNSCCNF